MVFTKTYIDEPLKLPILKGWHWRRNSLGSRDIYADLRRAGSTSPLGLKECYGCTLPLYDPFHLFAAGKSWHKSCFKCCVCSITLNPDKYHEKNGLPYCERDYNSIYYHKCNVCCTNIYKNPIRIKEKAYHPACFTCKKCNLSLNAYNYRERNGRFYCETDYHNTFSPKCQACKRPIKDTDESTKTIGGIFHKEHFVCHECKFPLYGNEFRQVSGNVYCEHDYHKLFSPKCEFCSTPVKQGGLRIYGKVWHSECRFRCSTCMKFLSRDDYIRGADDRPYCRSDWHKKFQASICPTCNRNVHPNSTGKSVIAMGKEWHTSCFYCRACYTDLDTGSYWEVNGRPYCYKHYYDRTFQRSSRQIPILKEITSDNFTKTLGRLKLGSSTSSIMANTTFRRSTTSMDRVGWK